LSRHTATRHSLENETQLIVTTLRITNEQNGENES